MSSKLTQLPLLLVIASASAFAQYFPPGGGGSGGATSSSELSDAAVIQKSTLPTFEADTCNATVLVNTLVQMSADRVIPANASSAVYGIARTACSIGTGTTVAVLGSQDCVADGAIAANRLIIRGTTDPTKCSDSGTAIETSIPAATPIVGYSRAAVSSGATFEVTLTGPGRFGKQSSGTLPSRASVTGGATSVTVTIDLNQTLTHPSQALPSCAATTTISGLPDKSGFAVGNYYFNAGLTQMLITFTTVPATGECTAIIQGGGGGGGAGSGSPFDSNTTVSVDGELWAASGTGGKTAKRSNLTAAVTAMVAGIPSAQTYSGLLGLWTGCTGQKVPSADGTCIDAGGGVSGTYVAGTGIAITGNVISIHSTSGRAFLRGTASLSFGLIPARDCAVLTFTFPGALVGDYTAGVLRPLDVNTSATLNGTQWGIDAWISAGTDATNGIATVQLCNRTSASLDPTDNLTFGLDISKMP